MISAMARLGDRLLERLVPKTVAAACGGVEAQAEWYERCYCNWTEPQYNCQFMYRLCGVCGGTTYCTECIMSGERCC